MSIWATIWVVAMMFWLFGGGYTAYHGEKFNPVVFGGGTLVPWVCVLILGLILFGAVPHGPIR